MAMPGAAAYDTAFERPDRSKRRFLVLVATSSLKVLRRPIESTQDASEIYRAVLTAHGLIGSMSRHGNVYDCECTVLPTFRGSSTSSTPPRGHIPRSAISAPCSSRINTPGRESKQQLDPGHPKGRIPYRPGLSIGIGPSSACRTSRYSAGMSSLCVGMQVRRIRDHHSLQGRPTRSH